MATFQSNYMAAISDNQEVYCYVMAAASSDDLQALSERLLNCEICTNIFDSKSYVPYILPCHHTFCASCIDQCGRLGPFSCPLCRSPIHFDRGVSAAKQFPVDTTRIALIDWTSSVVDKSTACTKACETLQHCAIHLDEQMKYFCFTCQKYVCPSCALADHNKRDGHDIVHYNFELDETKKEVLQLCTQIDDIRAIVAARADAIIAAILALETNYNQMIKSVDQTFTLLVASILERQKQVTEDLRAKMAPEKERLEEQLASLQVSLTAAQLSTDMARRVVSLGMPSEVLTQQQEIQGTLTELTELSKELLTPAADYQIDTSQLSIIRQSVTRFGDVHKVEPEATKDCVSPTNPGGEHDVVYDNDDTHHTIHNSHANTDHGLVSPTERSSLSHRMQMQCPNITWDTSRCGSFCSLNATSVSLSNRPPPQTTSLQASQYSFPGTRGSIALSRGVVTYWQVKVSVTPASHIKDCKSWCEVGLATDAALQACEGGWISDSRNTAFTARLWRDGGEVGTTARYSGVFLTKVSLGPCSASAPIQRTLGFLMDGKRRRLHVIDVNGCRVLWKQDMDMCHSVWPAVSVQPIGDIGAVVRVELVTGRKLELTSSIITLLRRQLVGRIP